MIIKVKKLSGPDCDLEVSSNSTIIYVKELVAKQLQIPVNKQKLVFKGKTLSDEMSLRDYNIVEGNKLHLFVSESGLASHIDNNESNPFWEQLTKLLLKHYSSQDVNRIIAEFKRNLQSDVDDLSLDDIERLAKLKLSQQDINK